MAQQASSSGRGWIVVLAALGINLILGALYAWSVVGKALTGKDFGWTQTQANLPFATATAVFAVTMIFAGRIQDKIGPRALTVVGGVMLGGGMVISSFFAHSPVLMCLTFGVIGGMGIGLGYAATTPASMKWFHGSRKGLITGIVVSGIALSSVYMAPLTRYLLATLGSTAADGKTAVVGLQPTLMWLGIGTAIIVPLLSLLMINPPAGFVPAAPASSASAKKRALPSRPDRGWSHVLSTPQFILLWITFILAATPGLMLLANAAKIAALVNPAKVGPVFETLDAFFKNHSTLAKLIPLDAGVMMVMALGVFNMVGRLLSGFVSDRIGRTNTMLLAFLLQAGNMYYFPHYTTFTLLVFGAAFTGLCYGAIFTLMPAAMADFFGVKNLGVNYGMLFTAFGVAGVTGSLLGGKVADLLGSYDRAYITVAVMLVAAAMLAFVTRPPKIAEDAIAASPAKEPGKA